MRIVLHSNAPFVKTGYGQQTNLWAPRIKAMGHDVAVSAFYGLSGTAVNWDGIPVFPAGVRPNTYGMEMIPYFYEKWHADVAIVLADAWVGKDYTAELSRLNVANWLPVDAYPLSSRDRAYLEATGATPIAMSRFGERLLVDAGFEPLYMPHAVDTSVFRPADPAVRAEIRAGMGLDDETFLIGINAANRDLHRKGYFEQFTAFERFRADHPNSRLYVHTMVDHPSGLDIVSLARECGIQDAVIFPDQGPLAAGEITDQMLAVNFYWPLDLYSGAALAEGFGIPLIEAQACGVPVVTTDGSAMSELAGPGWAVPGDPMWVEGHQARWTKPYVREITAAYQDAWTRHGAAERSAEAREFALGYDVDRVAAEHWGPAVKLLEEGLR